MRLGLPGDLLHRPSSCVLRGGSPPSGSAPGSRGPARKRRRTAAEHPAGKGPYSCPLQQVLQGELRFRVPGRHVGGIVQSIGCRLLRGLNARLAGHVPQPGRAASAPGNAQQVPNGDFLCDPFNGTGDKTAPKGLRARRSPGQQFSGLATGGLGTHQRGTGSRTGHGGKAQGRGHPQGRHGGLVHQPPKGAVDAVLHRLLLLGRLAQPPLALRPGMHFLFGPEPFRSGAGLFQCCLQPLPLLLVLCGAYLPFQPVHLVLLGLVGYVVPVADGLPRGGMGSLSKAEEGACNLIPNSGKEVSLPLCLKLRGGVNRPPVCVCAFHGGLFRPQFPDLVQVVAVLG